METPPRRTASHPAFTLRSRLRMVFAATAVVVALGGSAAAALLVQLDRDADRLTDKVSPARIAATALGAAGSDQETGVRGYVLTGQEAFLGPYRAGRSQEVENAVRVRAALGDNPQVISALDDLTVALQAWRSGYAEPAIAKVTATDVEITPSDGTVETVETEEDDGKALFDEVRARITELNDELAVEREMARDALGAATKRLYVVVGIALAAGIAAAIAIWQALRSAVTLPLERLGAETRLVADGDFRRRLVVTGPAEITTLADDVDEMRGRIVALLEESEDRREELRAQSDELRVQGAELQAQGDELRAQGAELRAQTEELAGRELDLLRSNDELEQFAYVASHDLQEPLRKVASFCQMLQRRYSGQIDEQADQYIAFAVDGAKRMQVLINDLLAFSRVGRASEGMADVDTGELAAQAAEALSEICAEADAELDIAALPIVRGDDSLLTQLFQNLLGNALKFRAPGRACRIRLDAEIDGEYWHFRCVDTGIGIEPEYAERVFVIFQRLHTKDQYGGTGIGLALCKKIVEYHGGAIWIDTEREKGTTVHWTLPAALEPEIFPAIGPTAEDVPL